MLFFKFMIFLFYLIHYIKLNIRDSKGEISIMIEMQVKDVKESNGDILIKGTISTEVYKIDFSTCKRLVSLYLDELNDERVKFVTVDNSLAYGGETECEGEVILVKKDTLIDIYESLISDNIWKYPWNVYEVQPIHPRYPSTYINEGGKHFE